jgi:hypothetical protein
MSKVSGPEYWMDVHHGTDDTDGEDGEVNAG